MDTTAILLLHCPDQQGIISEVTKFITDNKGNIVYLDQYVDKVDGMFFMRIEWELEGFLIPRDKLYDYITTLYAQRYQMKFSLYYSDKRPRMAIFVSKMSHCLYDLLARWKAGEFNCDIPCIVWHAGRQVSSTATSLVSSATTRICATSPTSSAFPTMCGASRKITRTKKRWRKPRWNS